MPVSSPPVPVSRQLDEAHLAGHDVALLSGHIDVGLLDEPPLKVIRVFHSSTATDMVHERQCVVRETLAHLREYCRYKYGVDYQIVDLRLGETDDWPDDSYDRQICHKELADCLHDSIGPNFVMFLGQRYGCRLLPTRIPDRLFTVIRQALATSGKRDTREWPLLDLWYWRDDNDQPEPSYVLQPHDDSSTTIQQMQMSFYKTISYKDNKQSTFDWPDTRLTLQRLFRKGVEHCLLQASLTPDEALPFFVSDLEEEVSEGLLRREDPSNHCLLFLRTIDDLKNYSHLPAARRFAEVSVREDGRSAIDPKCADMLHELVNSKIPRVLSPHNVTSLSILWRHDDVVNEQYHADYLAKVAAEYEANMRELIDSSSSVIKEGVASTGARRRAAIDGVEEEVRRHWLLAKNRAAHHYPRHDLVGRLYDYLASNSPRPLVLHGPHGAGKTSLVSQIAAELAEKSTPTVAVIVRFLAMTSQPVSIQSFLYGICIQLATFLHTPVDAIPKQYRELEEYFKQLIQGFPVGHSAIILIDSIHSLSAEYEPYHFFWLPRLLPTNIRVVMSTCDGEVVLRTLQQEIVIDAENFIQLSPLSQVESMECLRLFLAQERRCLSEQQEQALSQALPQTLYPLFMKLVAREARYWVSYASIQNASLPDSVDHFIEVLFEQLEHTHGKALVSATCAYLTASKTGLSDCEIEDLLSLDNSVLYETWGGKPPLGRIPSFKWVRFRRDIDAFLIRINCDGLIVYYWDSELLVRFTTRRYLCDEEHVRQLYGNLADYYLGVWSEGNAKPFSAPSVAEVKLDRLVPSQPLNYETLDGRTRYNRRKLDQLPRHLHKAGRFTELEELVLFNYEWIYNKIHAFSMEHVLYDFSLHQIIESQLVQKAISDAATSISYNINLLPSELSGRLLTYCHIHHKIGQLVGQCDSVGVNHCGLIPTIPYHQVPGNCLEWSATCPGNPTSFAIVGENSRYLLAKDQSNALVYVFDLITGDIKGKITTSLGDLYVTPNEELLAIVDSKKDKAVKIHSCKDGSFKGHLIPLNYVQMKPSEKYKLTHFCLTDNHVCMIATTDVSYLCIADLQTCKLLHVIGLDSRSDICAVTKNSRFVWCNAKDRLLTYDLYSFALSNSHTLKNRPRQIIFNATGSRAFLINHNESGMYLASVESGVIKTMDYVHMLTEALVETCDEAQWLTLSHNEMLVLLRGLHSLVVYDLTSNKKVHNFKKPDDLPAEFRLPKSDYNKITFTSSQFTPDDQMVVGAIFRNVYIWNISTHALLAVVQGPVGIIYDVFLPAFRGQLITHLKNSGTIQGWNLRQALVESGYCDRVTSPIDEIRLTADDSKAFVRCKLSDEVGIFDLKTGKLQDLLTHEGKVIRFCVSCTGTHALVSIESPKQNVCNKIWYVDERKFLYEFGRSPAHSVPFSSENTMAVLYQEELSFKTPFDIALFKFNGENFDEYIINQAVKFVLAEPFLTAEDKYLVCLTADDYNESRAHYVNPTIFAIQLTGSQVANGNGHYAQDETGTLTSTTGLKGKFRVETYSAFDFKASVCMTRILHIRPHPHGPYCVLVMFTREPDLLTPSEVRKGYEHCYGFMVLDLCSGVLCQIVPELIVPPTPLEGLLFTPNMRYCIDNMSNVFDLDSGSYVKQIFSEGLKPSCLALNGQVILFVQETKLFAVRLADCQQVGAVDVHKSVTAVVVCHDGRTVVVGCTDGSILSYAIVDLLLDDKKSTDVIMNIANHQQLLSLTFRLNSACRVWDKVGPPSGQPYSRPPSALSVGPTDGEVLRRITPSAKYRPSPASDFIRSATCSVM